MGNRYHHGDLRAALLDAAAAMIAESGVEQVTIRGLAQRVGVSHTAPYRHFANKNALLAAVAEDGFNRLVVRLREIREAHPAEPELCLRQLFVVYVEFALGNPTHYRLMYGEEVFSRKEYPELSVIAHQVFNEFFAVVQQGQQAHIYRANLGVKITCSIWALAHGLSLLVLDGMLPVADDFENAVGSLLILASDGFREK